MIFQNEGLIARRIGDLDDEELGSKLPFRWRGEIPFGDFAIPQRLMHKIIRNLETQENM